MRRSLSLATVAATLCLVPACGSGSTPADESSGLQIVTTVAPITSLVAQIAGDTARIEGVVPEGTNSHTFEPPPQTAALMERADLVFLNGLQLEEPTYELARDNVPDGTELVQLGDEVLPESSYIFDFSFPEKDGKPNPHLWTDPTYAIKYAEVIARTLTTADPDNASTFQANLAAFTTKATALSEALRADQATIPGGRRLLLTYHDAYAYFAKTYDWTVVGAVQPSNFEDPQPREVARLIDQVRTLKVPTIFGSEVFPSKVLAQIADETGVRYEESLRDDDLPGKPGDADHSWLGLMRYDYVTMVKGLGGTPTRLQAVDTADVTPDRADYPQ